VLGGALFSFFLLPANRLNIITVLKSLRSKDIATYIYLIACIGIMQPTTNYELVYLAVGYALSMFHLSTLVSVLLGHRFFSHLSIS
jgi:hypothetical protein